MGGKITKAVVDAAEADPGRSQTFVWDREIKGFGLRVLPGGTKAFIFQYRAAGRSRRLTIGKVGTIEPNRARDIAKSYAANVAAGRDPMAEKQAARATAREAARRERQTFERTAAEFIEKYAKPKNRSWRATQALLARHVTPVWGGRPVEEISKRDVHELLDPIAARAPVLVNRVHAALRRLFGWCVERGIIHASPMAGLRPRGIERKRERALNAQEAAALWAAAARLDYPFGPFWRLLLLTAQRRGEVAKMRWESIDLDKRTWTLTAEETKAKRAHVVPLSEPAVEILRAIRPQPPQDRKAEGYVFTSSGARAVSGFSRAKQRLDKLSGVSDWRLHDLRRTAATGMAQLGSPPHVIARVLNHAPDTVEGITATYNRHTYLPEMRRALEQWAAVVAHAAEPVNKVVQLRG
jgi:integrase